MIGPTLENGLLDMELQYGDGLRASILLSILGTKNSSWIAGVLNVGNEFGFTKVENMGKMRRQFLESLDWMTTTGLATEVEVNIEVQDEAMTVYVDTELSDGERKRLNFYFEKGKLKEGM